MVLFPCYKIKGDEVATIKVFNKVDFGEGRVVWVGMLNGIVFVNNNISKLQLLLDALGSDEQVPVCDPISLQEFKDFVETNEVLKAVNWKDIGVSI